MTWGQLSLDGTQDAPRLTSHLGLSTRAPTLNIEADDTNTQTDSTIPKTTTVMAEKISLYNLAGTCSPQSRHPAQQMPQSEKRAAASC